jgi:mannose-6-phosphate isomerase-like protein (cupin superfamily)
VRRGLSFEAPCPKGRGLRGMRRSNHRRIKMISTIRLEDKIKKLDQPWSPIQVARVNDQVIRMSLLKGEYHWHKHTNEDELFYVYRGKIVIQLKDQEDILLREGEMVVIPKGVEHCPKSIEPSYVIVFEPYVLKSQGDE